jgi:hypothetical protein
MIELGKRVFDNHAGDKLKLTLNGEKKSVPSKVYETRWCLRAIGDFRVRTVKKKEANKTSQQEGEKTAPISSLELNEVAGPDSGHQSSSLTARRSLRAELCVVRNFDRQRRRNDSN